MAENKDNQGGLGESIRVIIHALLIAVVIRTLFFQPFNIPSGSMKSTLLVGDYLFVSKYAYGYSKYSIPFSPPLFSGRLIGSEPKRGDIAVFRPPHELDNDYIKRVIGLPGDKIQVVGGILHINGEAVKREPLPDFSEGEGYFEYRAAAFRETLPNGVSYTVLKRNRVSILDNSPVYEVPQGYYFMMGDNREDSADSRVFGPVPLVNFVGRAEILFFSIKEGERFWQFWRWPWALRWSRFFNILR